MTLYGYARVSVREPEDKNLDLQVERLVRAGCSLGNIRAEEASGARNDRGGLLELLDLVVEGLHRAGVEFRSLSEEFPFRIFEVDHIIPQSRGGTDHLENLQLLCPSCNRIKGDRPQEYLVARLAEIGV